MTKPLVSCFGLECLDFEESSYSQLPGSLSADCKYLHARKIPHQLNFTSKTTPDFKSQMNILVHIDTLACVKAEI